ncbi:MULTISPECIES: multicopper oxidase family protein [Vibrio]|uniref:Multicopper oxidase family protein n=1 Tax=Vibrio mediterranei TaxID=689 RepID=A0A3G4VBS3_9VIBR|nr:MULTISPECIES: multicopper oxidase family protein [Vibrio]AYV21358.1 multicopper oxidase family protein [Vibrio mediterranei]USE00479.1 multicopper oxidase family protein [Vibrio sp. SCSIO 43133]
MNLSRRTFLKSSLSFSAIAAIPGCSLTKVSESQDRIVYDLTAQPTTAELVPGYQTEVLGFNGQIPAPTIRCKQGQKVVIRFTNKLDEPTTIHWHGLRIPIEMDGVPFLSQPPIMPNETFIYEFTPPDAGTFWYHPHMNSVVQLGKGLVGALIVEESEPLEFDHDMELVLKNWHIDKKGNWKQLMIPRYSARMGTPGEWGTVNGTNEPNYKVRPNGLIRARVVNVDNTLTYKIAVEGATAWVIAIDGNPISTPYKLTDHKMGPGMRLDLAIVAPKQDGSTVYVRHLKGNFPFPLCSFSVKGEGVAKEQKIPSLPLNPIPKPDLSNAITKDFVFEWEGAVTPASKDGKAIPKFWLMNKRAWEGMSEDKIPDPIAELELGRTYIFDLRNVTQYHHPIHLHGHTFTVLELDDKEVEPFHTDTVLLGKNGRAKVAFVADNPGSWMYHCHVIEHMKTGLMGYVKVS